MQHLFQAFHISSLGQPFLSQIHDLFAGHMAIKMAGPRAFPLDLASPSNFDTFEQPFVRLVLRHDKSNPDV